MTLSDLLTYLTFVGFFGDQVRSLGSPPRKRYYSKIVKANSKQVLMLLKLLLIELLNFTACAVSLFSMLM